MHTGDSQLSIDIQFPHDVGQAPPCRLDVAFDANDGAHRHWPEICHGDGATDMTGVEEPRLGYRDQCRRGQVVHDRSRGPAMEIAGFVAQARSDGHLPNRPIGLRFDQVSAIFQRQCIESLIVGILRNHFVQRKHSLFQGEVLEIEILVEMLLGWFVVGHYVLGESTLISWKFKLVVSDNPESDAEYEREREGNRTGNPRSIILYNQSAVKERREGT